MLALARLPVKRFAGWAGLPINIFKYLFSYLVIVVLIGKANSGDKLEKYK